GSPEFEEQEAIMKVLQRDAALKRAEEERVRHLPEKIKDDQQLKNMSGQWFYEAKAKRHA
uniref:Synaptotagmin-like protein 2 n=1 Tax=Homo sapiens TaxID=9606 RepID=UPI00017EE9B1|nr:Chain B, Synaptotagmin-like protein 2 [Homo sapiens]3BC1_F Chain F, Synaptotagmin-like protein 2 [Homo sapiens]